MVVLTIFANGLNLAVPKIMASIIDRYDQPGFVLSTVLWNSWESLPEFLSSPICKTSSRPSRAERIARDLRTRLVAKISVQDHAYIQQVISCEAADESHLGRGLDQDVRVSGHRLDHFIAISDHWRGNPAADD
jgi:hypothetical protein